MDIERKVLTFLEQDVLRHVVHLKMFHAYPDAIQCHYYEDGTSAGVLLLLPTQASPFDARTYPSTRYVVLPSAADQVAAHALVAHIPMDCDLVFKLIDGQSRAAIEEWFDLKRTWAYLSYTSCEGALFAPALRVQVSAQLDERSMPLYAENGYSLEEMQVYFSSGARSFTIHEGQEVASTCFVFPNFREVWEIAGVHTVPSWRGHGCARQVVETALSALLREERIPRYQVREDNRPSIRLAEAVGLEKFLTTEHFVGKWTR